MRCGHYLLAVPLKHVTWCCNKLAEGVNTTLLKMLSKHLSECYIITLVQCSGNMGGA